MTMTKVRSKVGPSVTAHNGNRDAQYQPIVRRMFFGDAAGMNGRRRADLLSRVLLFVLLTWSSHIVARQRQAKPVTAAAVF